MKKDNPGNQIAIETRSFISRAQLMDALAVFGSVGHLLTQAQFDSDAPRPELDGGVKSAVEATMINACARLDALLADKDRWSLKERDDLTKSIVKSYEASAKLFSKQTILAEAAATPHNAFRPLVSRIRPGFWMAIAGSLTNIDASICGVGPTPAAALACFDAAYNGKLTKEQEKFIQTLTNEKTLDNRRDANIDEVIDAEDTPPGDSPDSGEDADSGGEEDIQPPADGEPADGEPADGEPADGEPADGEPESDK